MFRQRNIQLSQKNFTGSEMTSGKHLAHSTAEFGLYGAVHLGVKKTAIFASFRDIQVNWASRWK